MSIGEGSSGERLGESRIPSRESRILSRVAQLRNEGRHRRLLVQLPPLVGGIAAAVAGFCLFVQQEPSEPAWFSIGGLICLHVGPWTTALALRPHDRRAMRALCLFSCALSSFAFIAGTPFLTISLASARATGEASAILYSASFAPIFVGVAVAAAVYLHAFVADLWLGASPHLTMTRLWRAMGLLSLWCSVGYAGFVMTALFVPNKSTYLRIEAVILVPLFLIVTSLGCLAFWEPLRTRVQEQLARIGEGISAAAGIAELVGGLPPDEVIALASRTFRALPVSAITIEHLALPTPPKRPELPQMQRHASILSLQIRTRGQRPGSMDEMDAELGSIARSCAAESKPHLIGQARATMSRMVRTSSMRGGAAPIASPLTARAPVTVRWKSTILPAPVHPEGPDLDGVKQISTNSTEDAERGSIDSVSADLTPEELFAVSSPAQLGTVDIFISHR
jgi:hypothetical protein